MLTPNRRGKSSAVSEDTVRLSWAPAREKASVVLSRVVTFFDNKVVSSLGELCANVYRCEWKELFMLGVLSM